MGEVMEANPGAGVLNQMISWLGSDDPDKIDIAATIFRRIGAPAVEFLVQAAGDPTMLPEHQLRVLAMVEEIGAPLSMPEFLQLRVLVQHGCPEVRPKAAEVLVKLNPVGPRLSPLRQFPKAGPKGLLRRAAATARKAAKSQKAQQRKAEGRNGRPKSVPAGDDEHCPHAAEFEKP